MKVVGTYTLLLIQAVLYIGYLFCDITETGNPKPLKIIAIFILLMFSLLAGKEKENKLVSVIFFFTFIADIFFVIINKTLYGISVYIIIQLTHTLRLSYMSEKKPAKELLKRIAPALCIGAVSSLFGPRLPLITVYAVCIAVNLAHVIKLKIQKPDSRNLRYMLGMIILVIGDIGVGIRNIQADFITDDVLKIAYIITWLTYVPSLILILSTTDALKLKNYKNFSKF